MSKSIKVGFSIKGLYQYYHMIKPIINANISDDIEFYIFHVNKYYKYNTAHIEITDATVIDLVKTTNVVKRFKELDLDYIIIFNPGQIFDVFITIICKELGIKSIYYQHGLSLPFGSFDIKMLSTGKKISDRFLSIKRYFFFYYKMALNLAFMRNKWNLIKILTKRSIQIFFQFGADDYPKYGLSDFHCDLAVVFGRSDKKYLISNNGFMDENVFIGGYPMVKPEKDTNDYALPKHYVLYLSSGLLTSKVIPITIEDERVFYHELAMKVKNSRKVLVIKLHPTENVELFNDYLKDFKDAFVYKDFNLSTLVVNADIVIGDYSTALFYPIRYMKPLILLQSEFFEKYPFDFADFGIGKRVSISNLEENIKNIPFVNVKHYKDFLLKYVSNSDAQDSNEILYKKLFFVDT